MNALAPHEAEVLERLQESRSIFTLRLRFTDPHARAAFAFVPGQFNMIYLYGVGEVPVSIMSDPRGPELLDHTIREVGRVTRGLARLRVGERVGLRGPFGSGWPLERVLGKDVLVVTGGLGCAPVVAVINYIIMRRERFGRLTIVQGVKHADDLIWRERYAYWASLPDVQVLISADEGGPLWPYHRGLVTGVFDRIDVGAHTMVMLCGPEAMMLAAVRLLRSRGVRDEHIWLSMERNMQCAVGHCGHCQFGPDLVCRDGPVFSYPQVERWLGRKGF